MMDWIECMEGWRMEVPVEWWRRLWQRSQMGVEMFEPGGSGSRVGVALPSAPSLNAAWKTSSSVCLSPFM